MKMIKDLQKQLHNKKSRVIVGFTLSLVLFCLAGGIWYAKYYAGRSNKGVAVSSSLYFTSNYLKNVSDKAVADYPVVYNTITWDGSGECTFLVKIQNYQNQLLYNDANLDIEYKIQFELMGESDEGTYQVKHGDVTKDITYNSNSEEATEQPETSCEFTTTLQGGQARADQFTVSVTKPSGNTEENYRSVGIKVTATPVSPSYVASYETLGGILYASTSSTQYELSGDFTKVKEPISGYAGFPYTISYKPGTDITEKKIKVSWNPIQLQIDKYSSYVENVKEETDSGGISIKYIEISIKPFTTFDIMFYRESGFNATILTDLKALVKTDIIMETETDTSNTGGGSE